MKDYSFGNYICALRTGLGLSQFQLGTLVGVTDKAVSKWENGDAKPRIATCYRLAAVLGVSVNELLSCEHYITIPARKELDKLNNKLWKEAYKRLSIYGTTPPAACWSRLASEEAALRETDAVQGFAVMGKLQEEARNQNTVIIATGAVNSSYAAWLFGGTLVNPLQAHYRCPSCGTVESVYDVNTGFDLPEKLCACGTEMIRDGHNLPYAGYAKAEQLGTHLEFRVSKRFLPIAAEVLKTFYAGITELLPVKLISDHNQDVIHRYVVLPETKARPTLSEDGFWHVSMEDYWEWQENETSFTFLIGEQLDKLDALVSLKHVSIPDFNTIMTPSIAEKLYQKRCQTVPNITGNLKTSNTLSFDLLLQIDGLSHSTYEWEVKKQMIPNDVMSHYSEIPATREDIWNSVSAALEQNNIRDNGLALLVMERARKGLFYSQGLPADIKQILLSIGLPAWYPALLSKVMYLFPKGHCIAYLLIDTLLTWMEHLE